MIQIARKKSWQEQANGAPGRGFWCGFLMLECPKGHRWTHRYEPKAHGRPRKGSELAIPR